MVPRDAKNMAEMVDDQPLPVPGHDQVSSEQFHTNKIVAVDSGFIHVLPLLDVICSFTRFKALPLLHLAAHT